MAARRQLARQPSEQSAYSATEGRNDISVSQTTLYIFLLTALLGGSASSVASPFTVFYAKAFDADDAQVGLLQATYSGCAVVMLPIVGKISDNFGRKTALMFCQTVIFVGAAITTLAGNLGDLFLGQFVISAGITIQTVQEMYIADVTNTQRARKFWYRRFWMADTIPNLVAPPLGGYLGMMSLRAPWAADCILSLVCLTLTYMFVKETPSWIEHRRKEQEQERQLVASGSRRNTITNFIAGQMAEERMIPFVVWFLVADGFFLGTANQGQNAMVSLWQQQELHFNPIQRGAYYPSFAVLTLISIQFITPYLHSRLGLYGTVICAAIVSASAQLCMATFAGGLMSSMLCFWLQSMSLSNRVVTIPAIVARYTKPATRGKIFVALMISQAVGRVVSPSILGVLANRDITVLPWFYLAACDCLSAGMVTTAFFLQPSNFDVEGAEEAPNAEEVQCCGGDVENGRKDGYKALPEVEARNR